MKKQITKTAKKGMSKGISKSKKVAIGAGVVAIGAIGAGAYYLLGPDGKKNQKKLSALAGKIKKEATSEYKKAKKLGAPMYNKAVDIVSKNYATQYKAHAKDINAIAKKIKSEWNSVAPKTVKKTVKKAANQVKSAVTKKRA